MSRLALVTATEAIGLDTDMPLLLDALRRAGAAAQEVVWDDAAVDWSAFDLVVLRSTWDCVPRLTDFLSWVDRVAASTRLLNPPEVVRWNTDKHYLLELHRKDVPVVPTRFVEPGERGALAGFLAGELSAGRSGSFAEFVLKPAVGAGSKDAARYGVEEREAAEVHLNRLLGEGRSAMLQPYLPSVDARGETALLCFDGAFHHAIRKGPLLQRGAGLVEGLFAAEDITPRTPTEPERAVAEAALAAMPFPALPYARVDLVEDPSGQPVVLELELTEPSLFLDQAEGAAADYAQVLLSRIR